MIDTIVSCSSAYIAFDLNFDCAHGLYLNFLLPIIVFRIIALRFITFCIIIMCIKIKLTSLQVTMLLLSRYTFIRFYVFFNSPE